MKAGIELTQPSLAILLTRSALDRGPEEDANQPHRFPRI